MQVARAVRENTQAGHARVTNIEATRSARGGNRTRVERRARVQKRKQNADKHELMRKVERLEQRAAHGFDRRRKDGRKRRQRNDAIHIAETLAVRHCAEQHGGRKAQNHDDGVDDLSARARMWRREQQAERNAPHGGSKEMRTNVIQVTESQREYVLHQTRPPSSTRTIDSADATDRKR